MFHNQRVSEGIGITVLKKVIDGIDWINEWIGKILYPLVMIICLIVFTEIVLRYVFNSPTIWSFESTQFLFIICSLLAAGHLHQKNAHIGVDILYGKFSSKWKLITDILLFPFFLLFIGSMSYFGFAFASDSLLKLERTGSVWDPYVFPLKFTIPIGATLLLLQGVARLVRDISNYRQGKRLSSEMESENIGSY